MVCLETPPSKRSLHTENSQLISTVNNTSFSKTLLTTERKLTRQQLFDIDFPQDF